MNNQFSNKYSPLFPLLTVVMCIGLSYFLINPFINRIRAVNTDIQLKNNELGQMDQKINDLNYLKDQFNKSLPDLKLLNTALPGGKKIDEIIIQFNNIAKNSNTTISSFKPSNKGANGSIGLDLSVNGSYDDIINFINSLENNARLISIKTLTLSPSSKKDITGSVQAILTVEVLDLSSLLTTADQKTASSSSKSTFGAKESNNE